MNRKFLEEQGLEKDQIDAVMKEHGKALGTLTNDLETAQEKTKNLQEQLDSRDADIKALKEESGSNEELTKQLEQWETKYQDDTQALEQRLKDQELQSAIKLSVLQAGARNSKAVTALLDTEGLEIEDGKVKGLDEKISALKESDAYLFDIPEEPKDNDPQKPKGAQPGNQRKIDPDVPIDLSKMTYKEQVDFKIQHPEKYKELTQKQEGK